MKNRCLKTMLLAEGAACALLALALRLIAGAAFSVSGLPGSAVGQGLTSLASAGRFGFALALTLYAFLVLLPLYALVRIREKRALRGEDALLALISLAAACTLFPRGAAVYWSADMATLIPRLAWQWLIPALLAGWVVLRLLRRFLDGDTQALSAQFLLNTLISIPLPLFELCFVLAALLGARLIESNVTLAADNELFI